LLRSWNQTGQKFAGEPDIVKMYFFRSPNLLWLLILATYIFVSFQLLPSLDGLPYMAVTGLTSVLITSAFSFKLAFTAEDAPELMAGFAGSVYEAFQGQSLLFRARLVFTLLAISIAFAVYRCFTGGSRGAVSAGKKPPLLILA
jgi:ethanolaminephosphotransferase